ncbi:SPW repeat protein [Amnibacterium sp.]|uniref:SPW repeat protein n=1 Tax=Amnibacterium sp. TaxID=1872496 RepID=UPI003F7B9F2B
MSQRINTETGQPVQRTHDTDAQFERITRGFAAPDVVPGGGAVGRAGAIVSASSGINVLAGLWLIVAPWVAGYSGQTGATWNEVAVGVAVSLIGLCRMLAPISTMMLSLVNLVLGAWMIVAPWLPNLHTGVTALSVWNQVITGIVIAALAIWSASSSVAGTRDRTA